MTDESIDSRLKRYFREELSNIADPGKHEFDQALQRAQDRLNCEPLNDFEGLSPLQMRYILYSPYQPDAPFAIETSVPESMAETSPMYRILRKYLLIIEAEKEVKLTPKGNLPVRIVKELYEKRILPDRHIEHGITKLSGQDDWLALATGVLVADLAGITKKRKGLVSLTKEGRLLLQDAPRLFKTLYETYAVKFRWSYNDIHEDEQAGQFGALYLLYLFKKHGVQPLPANWYVEKYFAAFPNLHRDRSAEHVVTTRFFDRFALQWGLIEAVEDRYDNGNRIFIVRKSPLLDAMMP